MPSDAHQPRDGLALARLVNGMGAVSLFLTTEKLPLFGFYVVM